MKGVTIETVVKIKNYTKDCKKIISYIYFIRDVR